MGVACFGWCRTLRGPPGPRGQAALATPSPQPGRFARPHDLGSHVQRTLVDRGRLPPHRVYVEDHRCPRHDAIRASRVHAMGADTMSDRAPSTPDEARELMNNLAFDPPPSPEQAEALLASLPPAGAEVMVVRSLRLSVDV